MLELTDQTFKAEVVDSDMPVMVDFSATWCGPCKRLAPLVEELAGEYEGKVKIFKLDIDAARQTAMNFNVMSVPTLLFFKGGEKVGELVGAHPKNRLKSMIDATLLGN
ncbi:MAG: thioredoxin [Planctomycetota bacterium]|jgi:thioredoxin 1